MTIAGGIQAGDAVTINIGGQPTTDSAGKVTTTGGADYKYTITKDDSISNMFAVYVKQKGCVPQPRRL